MADDSTAPDLLTPTNDDNASPSAFDWPPPTVGLDRADLVLMGRERFGIPARSRPVVVLRQDDRDVAAWEAPDIRAEFHPAWVIDAARAAGVRVLGNGGAVADLADGTAIMVPTGALASLPAGAVLNLARQRFDAPVDAVPVFVAAHGERELARLVGDVRIDFYEPHPLDLVNNEDATEGATNGLVEPSDDGREDRPATENHDPADVVAVADAPATVAPVREAALKADPQTMADLLRREKAVMHHSALADGYAHNVAQLHQLTATICRAMQVRYLAMLRCEPEDARTNLLRVNHASGLLQLFETVLQQIAAETQPHDATIADDLRRTSEYVAELAKDLDLSLPLPEPTSGGAADTTNTD